MIARGMIAAGLLWPCLGLAAIPPVIRPYLEIDGKELQPDQPVLTQNCAGLGGYSKRP